MKSILSWSRVALLSLLASCASRIAYTPACIYGDVDATKIIRRFLEEQPAKYAPVEIEISNEKISLTRYRGGPGESHPVVSTLYWDSIGSAGLWYTGRGVPGKWYLVKVVDKNGSLFASAGSKSERDAQRFLDAIESLRSARSSEQPNENSVRPESPQNP